LNVGLIMSQPILFLITTIGFSFIAWGIVAAWYFWPQLRDRSRAEAMRPLLLLHSFRFVGLSFLVPGVVSPDLPAAWAGPAAYGDLIAAILALLALAGLKSRLGTPLVWVFNVWGSADLLYAFYQANRVELDAGQLGAAYFIVTIFVPLLLVTHGLLFCLLLSRDVAAAKPDSRRAAKSTPERGTLHEMLMSAFHSPPWLKLISSRRKRRPRGGSYA
jgi:hypothetical protein